MWKTTDAVKKQTESLKQKRALKKYHISSILKLEWTKR